MALQSSYLHNLSSVLCIENDNANTDDTHLPDHVKRDLRLLRAKVINILEKNFAPSLSVNIIRKPAYVMQRSQSSGVIETHKKIEEGKVPKNTFKVINKMQYEFVRSRKREFENILASKAHKVIVPKYYDREYEPTVAKIKFPASEYKYPEYIFDKPYPTIDLLCQHLYPVEIEHVSRDPIYFLGIEQYQKDPNLTNLKEWKKIAKIKNQEWEKQQNDKEQESTVFHTTRNTLRDSHLAQSRAKSCIRNSKVEESEDPIIKKQKLVVQRSSSVKARLARDVQRFEENKQTEEKWEERRIRSINYRLGRRFNRSDSVKREIEKTKKKKVYLAQQQEDEMHERLKQIRQKQKLEDQIKQTNLQIQHNFVERLAKQAQKAAKLAKIERAVMYQAFANRNAISGLINAETKDDQMSPQQLDTLE